MLDLAVLYYQRRTVSRLCTYSPTRFGISLKLVGVAQDRFCEFGRTHAERGIL